MALPASGAISTADMATELGLATTAAFNTDDYALKGMALSSSDGIYSVDDLYGTTARDLFNTKVTTMVIGFGSGGGTNIYGFNSGASRGSMANRSVTFSDGSSGTINFLEVTSTGVNSAISVDVSPLTSGDFRHSGSLQGPTVTFYHAGTGSTKVLTSTGGSVFASTAAVGLPADTSWFSTRVGETVTVTIEPR